MKDLKDRIGKIEDRAALKELVDNFSILADLKDVQKQLLLFTENATVESTINGQVVGLLNGRKQIGEAFENFLNNFETVYHINGQQTVTLYGDKASGISCCTVTLLGTENEKKIKTTMGVYYNDDYEKENEKWLIAKRKSNFVWQDKLELGQ